MVASLSLQGITYTRILKDVLLLLAHAFILSIHIFIPEGNYGRWIRVYHPSTLSTVFSLKQYSAVGASGSRNPLAGHSNKAFQAQIFSHTKSPLRHRSDNRENYSQMGGLENRGRKRWSILDWDLDWEDSNGGITSSYSSSSPSIPSTSVRTKFLGRERNGGCCEVPHWVLRFWRWLRGFLMKAFYTVGALICLPLISIALYLLGRNLLDHEWRTQTIMLIPGFNIALGVEAVLLFISVLSVSMIHEWGHIICATLFDYRVKQFGGMAYGPVWMGVSEIEWTSREDGSSKAITRDDWKRKVIILLAGVWHNFCTCAIIYLLGFSLWNKDDGVRIVGGDPTGTIPESGMRIFKINDGEMLRTTEQFYTQISTFTNLSQSSPTGTPLLYCIPRGRTAKVEGNCCESKTIVGSHFCLEKVNKTSSPVKQPDVEGVEGATSSESFETSICSSIKDFIVRSTFRREDEECYRLKYPKENWQVISMKVGHYRDMSDVQTILFYGDIGKFFQSLEVTDRHLKWGLDETIPPSVSETLYRFIQIAFTLSFGFGILNLLPIPMFDGSHVVSTILFEIAKWGASSKLTQVMVSVHLIFVASCCVLFSLNVLLSLWNAYTMFVL